MPIALPPQFEAKMKQLLGKQFELFIASYDKPRKYGLRINELKINTETWHKSSSIKGEIVPIPWVPTGFYYEEQTRPAKHPHYQAGLYYIQEPSAMVPVELLDIQAGHRVLDLCAAPGGKSTQIASKLQNRGVLVTNDLATERTKALAKNIELAGIRNAIVLNERPEHIAEAFPHYFDRVLVDAPCSGEGMFRKNEDMINEWYNYSVDRCAKMQHDILQVVAQMVAPGGKLVYSTCTFSPEENETQIAKFIATHDDFEVIAIDASKWGWENGRADWVSDSVKSSLSPERLKTINGTLRLWPHLTDGEGHFVALLQRKGERTCEINEEISYTLEDIDWYDVNLQAVNDQQQRLKGEKQAKRQKTLNSTKHHDKADARSKVKKISDDSKLNQQVKALFNHMSTEFVQLSLKEPMKAVSLGTRVYLQPAAVPSLSKLKIVRAGWYIGEIKHQKFVPSQSFVMGISKPEMLKYISLASDSEQLERFLRGETLFLSDVQLEGDFQAANGYAFILVDDYVVGFVKIVDHMLKNEIPSGWRQLN